MELGAVIEFAVEAACFETGAVNVGCLRACVFGGVCCECLQFYIKGALSPDPFTAHLLNIQQLSLFFTIGCTIAHSLIA